MKTRKELLRKECTHREFYAQFVNPNYLVLVQNRIGLAEILEHKDTPHLSGIPITRWDMLPAPLGAAEKMKLAGDYLTLAGKNCIAKEAAKQIIEKNK